MLKPWEAPKPETGERIDAWLARVMASLEERVTAVTGIPPDRSPEGERERFIRHCRALVREEGIGTLFGKRLDTLDPEALLWAARALGAMYARASGLMPGKE